ncbi:MAG: hypothetical protein AMXMBFR84_05930 [Candidatus Hydrogenedentota bacterium]
MTRIPRPTSKIILFVPALLAFLFAMPALWTGLFMDDLWHKALFTGVEAAVPFSENRFSMFTFVNGDPERTATLKNMGVFPWWALDNLRLKFWRPVTSITHWMDYALWPDSEWTMHLHSLVWYVLGVATVAWLFRRILGVGWIALIAAALYAVDDAHANPVGWLANRNSLIALFFGVASILAHMRWRETNRWPWLPAALLLFAIALLANEGAIASTAYFFSYAVFLDKGTWKSRILTLVPYFVLVLVWKALYSMQGYGAWGSAAYIDPVASPMDFLWSLTTRGPILLLAQIALPTADLHTFVPDSVKFAWWVFAILALTAVGAILARVLRDDPRARFFAAGAVISIVPCCATFAMDRLLLFTGIGAFGLLAVWLASLYGKPRAKLVSVAAAVALLIHGVVGPLLLPVRIVAWDLMGQMVNRTYDSVEFTEADKDKTVVLVNAPNIFIATYLPITKALQGAPIPKRVVGLAPISGMPVPIVMRRTDANTIVYRPDASFQWILFRNDAHPFRVGDVVRLDDREVEILHVNEKGVPVEVAYRFDRPIDDPSMMWLRFEMPETLNGDPPRLVPYTPPAIGQTVTVASGTK